MAARFLKSLCGWAGWTLFVAAATLGIGLVWFPAPIQQPLSYNHQPHVELGCDFCHKGVKTQARASLPDIGVCVDCHDKAPVKAPAEIATWDQAVKDKHIAWQPLTRVRNHVYFSHYRHVELGKLECVTCHGDMAKRTSPPPHALKPMSMTICVDCHRQKQVSTDCAGCHK
jgi:hypothetical protein